VAYDEKFAMTPTTARSSPGSWRRDLNRHHWWVLLVAALAWSFDTMDQRIFILARGPAMSSLLPPGTAGAEVTYYSGLATAIFMLGWAIGGFYFGILGDRWGRAKTMLVTILLYSAFTGLSAISRGFWDFSLYRFLTGLGVGGEFAAGVTLVAEVMPASARAHALGLLQSFGAVGNLLGSLLSFVILPLGWRWMFVVGVFPALLVAVVFRKIGEPESWREARASAGHRPTAKLGALDDLFRNPRWRRNTIVGLVMAIAGVVGLWGVGLWTPELIREALTHASPESKSRYVSLGALLQDMGAFLGISAFTVLTARIGRRAAFMISFLIAFAATVWTFQNLHDQTQILWMLPVLGFSTMLVIGGYAIYLPELYPTRIRSSGVGFCYNAGRIVAAGGPFLLGSLTVALRDSGVASPFRAAASAVALIYLLGIVATVFAPETAGKPLPGE
jgi:MFS family permease